jgi:hypothetical protein
MEVLSVVVLALVSLVLQFPFLALIGLPWLLAAWVWWKYGSYRVHPFTRVIVGAALATCGVAPTISPHGGLPLYLVVITGEAIPPYSALSFAITFLIMLGVYSLLARRDGSAQSNKPVQPAPGGAADR